MTSQDYWQRLWPASTYGIAYRRTASIAEDGAPQSFAEAASTFCNDTVRALLLSLVKITGNYYFY